MGNYRAAGFGPCCEQTISLTEVVFDSGLNTPNLVSAEGIDTGFGASLSVKGPVLYGQVSEVGGYSGTPIYGYAALKTSDNASTPGTFEIGNHGVLSNQTFFSVDMVNGYVKVNSLATGVTSMVTADADGNLTPQGPMQEFADNDAALTAGKLVGQFYRTGEVVKVVF